MGKTTGFMEYMRSEASHRPALERIADYEPYLLPCSEDHIHIQSARCMDCGVPFCHAGIQIHGSDNSIGCPLGTLIPEINDLAYRGDWDEAFRRLLLRHPFPEITGRVCPALCEGSCVEGNFSQAVTIKDIERTLASHGLANNLSYQNTAKPTGKTVAVVGSGPAGLAVAHVLSLLGHRVRVYEKDDRPGGLLMYGIPNMKLEKSVIEDRVSLLKAQGVEFFLTCEVGEALRVDDLVEEHHAVVLCIGAREQRGIHVPGCEAQGVVQALEYLTASTRELLDGSPLDECMNALNKDVVILGGGDTSTDCIATALRQGAKSITVLKRTPSLPEKRTTDNPWPLWPRIKTTDYGHEEALARYGSEVREYETTIKEVLHLEGRCTGVVSTKVRWDEDEKGRSIATELPETFTTRKADLVITAKGFVGVESSLPNLMELDITSLGTIKTIEDDTSNRGEYATHLPGVFVAGDARRGPSLVVWAIQEGIKAAQECDAYLNR